MPFDIEGARKSGYSDAEIVDHLAPQSKFDAGAARKSGYSDAEILQHLSPGPSMLADVGKQALSGLVTGTEAIPSTPAILAGLGGKGFEALFPSLVSKEAGEQQSSLRDLITKNRGGGIAQYLPKPQTPAGEAARGVTEFIPSALAATPGSLARGLAAGTGAGLASEGAGYATKGTEAELPARIGGALVGGAAGLRGAERVGAVGAYRGAPNAGQLGEAVDQGYTAARGLGVELHPTAVSGALKNIKSGASPDLNQKTRAVLSRYEAEMAPTPQAAPDAMSRLTGVQPGAPAAKAPVDFDKLDALRRELGELVANKADPVEARAAKIAQGKLDKFIENIAPADVLRGDAAALSQTAKEARGNAAAEFRLRALQSATTRAEDQAASAHSGRNVENSYRQQLKAFVRPNNKGVSPAMREGFNREEIATLRDAARATSFPNMIRSLGNLTGGNMAKIGGGVATYETGDPAYLAAVAGGHLTKSLGNAMARARQAKLERTIAARSPLSVEMGVRTPQPALPAPETAALLSNLGAFAPLRMTVTPETGGYR